ncbi:hypothetical protein BJX96DRAFT_170735 [Aspergillus floccosus]
MARVVVVGAGLYGLITAKTYLQVTSAYDRPQAPETYEDEVPDCFASTCGDASALLVIDSASDIGGTWARERLYPNLLSQNSYGLYEYSDLPLADAVRSDPESEAEEQFIPGWKINQYLHIWCRKWDLHKHIRLNWKVSSISRLPSKEWALDILITDSYPRSVTIVCDKLVLATGLTSEPNIPDTPCIHKDREKQSDLPVIHAKQVGEYCRQQLGYEPVLRDAVDADAVSPPSPAEYKPIRSVAIQGGAKSSFDFVHLFASLHRNAPSLHLNVKHRHPVQVHWIIDERSSPAWMAPPQARLPTGKIVASDKAASTRLVGILSPCVYFEQSLLRTLLHGNPLGRWVVRRVWRAVDCELEASAQYRAHAKMEKLRPSYTAIDCASSGGIANHANFWETIRAPNVHVHRSRVVAVSGDESFVTVHLGNGLQIPDMGLVIHATGWKPVVPVLWEPPELSAALGLPGYLGDSKQIEHSRTLAEWRLRDQLVESRMRRRFPWRIFKDGPSHRHRHTTPHRLFRRMVSPALAAEGDRSLVVVGLVLSSTVGVVAEVQALWAAAFLTGGLDPWMEAIAEEDMRQSISEDVVWGRLTGSGLDVDAIQYNDQLLHDLGLNSRRQGGFWREFTSVYTPSMYAVIVDEWMKQQTP